MEGQAKKYNNLSKNLALFSISSFGSRIISFLLVPLYTSVLTTQEYGSVDIMSTTAALLLPLMTMSIQDAVLRFTLDERCNPQNVISIGFKINLYASGILLLALILLHSWGVLQKDFSLLAFLFCTFLFTGLNNCFTLYLKGTERISILVISGISNTLITCVLNIYLLIFLKLGVNGYLVANILGQVVATGIQFLGGRIYKDIHAKTEKILLKEMVNYSTPLIANGLSWWINNSSDRYILILFKGISENGILSVAYKIPTILSTIQNIFYSAWSISAISEFDAEDKDGFLGNTYSLYSALSIISCSIILLLNRPLAYFLYAKDFFRAWQTVPFLLVGTVFNGIAVFQGSLFAATKRTEDVSKSTIVGASINTICNFLFIYFFGVVGAAFATMLGYIVVWCMRTIKLNQFVHLKVNWRKHLTSCLLIVLQAFMALNESFIWIEAIVFVILVVLQGKYVIRILNKVCKRFFKQ